VKVPHIHAEVIKAWADNPSLIIEWRYNDQEWKLCDEVPLWNRLNEYRVKPEPPAKVYPETQMSEETMRTAYDLHFGGSVFGALTRVANAALHHAIDAGQIITMNDHHSALDTLGRSLRDIAITRHTDRDMAIARAVENVYCCLVPHKQPNSDGYLAAIIAKVAT
jgi:hypothetical protein